ncbi:MAG: hypothetical protein EZS28_014712, partial [Streblomastix strix]
YTGGGMYIFSQVPNSKIELTGLNLIENCSANSEGGGIYAYNQGLNSILQLSGQTTFQNCSSESSGGGMIVLLNDGAGFKLSGTYKFKNCSGFSGGGMMLNCNDIGDKIQLLGEITFENCSSLFQGGGMRLALFDGSTAEVNKITCVDCISGYDDEALYAGENGGGTSLSLINGCVMALIGSNFTSCINQIGSGGGLFVEIYQSNNQLEIKDVIFKHCHSGRDGGGMYVRCQEIGSKMQLTGQNTFENCSASWSGGGLWLLSYNGAQLQVSGTCLFKNCSQTVFGGGIYVECQYERSQIIMTGTMTFENCSSESSGGGMYLQPRYGSQIIIQGTCLFENCQALDSGGGGLQGYVYDEDTLLQISGQMTFDTCYALWLGGGMQLVVMNKASVEINEIIFINCSVDNTVGQGGGFCLQLQDSSYMIIESQTYTNCSGYHSGGLFAILHAGINKLEMVDLSFQDCFSIGYGGGITIGSGNTNNQILITGELIAENCLNEEKGGGLYIYANNGINLDLIGLYFQECFAQNGGGLSLNGFDGNVKMKLKDSQFINCSSSEQGGGLQLVLFSSENEIVMISSIFRNCSASLFGGGIYVQSQGIGSKIQLQGQNLFQNCQALGQYAGAGGIFIRIFDGATFETDQTLINRCYSQDGAGINTYQYNMGKVIIKRSNFSNCHSQSGGAIYSQILDIGTTTEIINCQFKNCESFNGGALFIRLVRGGLIKLNESCLFSQCVSNGGSGGAIFIETQFNSNGLNAFIIDDATIQECQAKVDPLFSSIKQGYGGAIFLMGNGDYNSQSKNLDFTGLKLIGNKADTSGQNIYIAMLKVREWCRLEMKGEYVKGNYSDTTSDEREIEGIPINYHDFLYNYSPQDLKKRQRPLECYWNIPYNEMYHIQYRKDGQQFGFDWIWCAEFDEPCKTIEYAIKRASFRKGGSESSFMNEKKVGITEGGFDLIYPLIFSPSTTYTNSIKIMKELYGTDIAMDQNAELNILKEDDDSKEVNKKGWISAIGGMNLGIYEVNIYSDSSTLNIPLIYIEDPTTSVEVEQSNFINTRFQLEGVHIDGFSINNAALIEIKFEEEFISMQNVINIERCLFNNIQSTIISSSLIESTKEDSNEIPIVAASVLNIRGINSVLFPIRISDSQFNCCQCEVQIPPIENRYLGIGGAISIIGQNMHINMVHLDIYQCFTRVVLLPISSSQTNSKTVERNISIFAQQIKQPNNSFSSSTSQIKPNSLNPSCKQGIKHQHLIESSGAIYISEVGNNGEGIFKAKKIISEQIRKNGNNDQDTSRIVDPLSRPSISFDSCVLKQCHTEIDGTNSVIKILESGGIILHSERTSVKYNFQQSIFRECYTSTSNSEQSTNIATNNPTEAFIPLWEREMIIGSDGSGLIIAHDKTNKPSIKASGINNHFKVLLESGRFSSQAVKIHETELLEIEGNGENSTMIMQQEITNNLFILNNSQINTSNLTAVLYGAESALIRSEGKGMSIINGLRVNGFNQYDTYTMGPVLEVVNGGLSLIDIQIKDLIVIQNNQQRNSENKIKGLIIMKENAQILQIERFSITNISLDQLQQNDSRSSIVMNAGKNARLRIRDGQFLGETSYSGNAIRIIPQETGIVEVEGVLFKDLSSDPSFDNNGGAVYIDMRDYYMIVTFKRCLFVGNVANYGSNIFIMYRIPSQRIQRSSFIGCTSIVDSSYQSDISACYTVGQNIDNIFTDERNLLHNSFQRQLNEDSVRFISNPDPDHIVHSNTECGQPQNPCNSFDSLIQQLDTQSPPEKVETIIFGEGIFISPYINLSLTRSNTVNIVGCGQDETQISSQSIAQNSLIEGQDGQSLIIERLRLILSSNSPSVGFINIKGIQSGLVIQDIRIQGYQDSTPQNTVLKPSYLIRVEGYALLRDVIIEHVFLQTGSILLMNNLKNINDKKEMEWLGNEQSGIYNCIFDDITSNESALIQLIENENGNAIFDSVYKHGLIYIERQGTLDNSTSNKGQVDIYGVFVAGCHSSVGSALTITGLTLEMSDSVFDQPLCFGNMIYLNQSITRIKLSKFKGYEGPFNNPSIVNQFGSQEDKSNIFCPDNSLYYSSPEYGLIFASKGEYQFECDVFEDSQVDTIVVDHSNVIIKDVIFNNPTGESHQKDQQQFSIICSGNSQIQIINPQVNGQTYDQCMSSPSSIKNECSFGVIKDDQCQIQMQDTWALPLIPLPVLSKARVNVNVQRTNDPMRFILDGDRMIQALFTVQIVELRDKTKEEIKLEKEANKNLQIKYNPKQINSQLLKVELNNININNQNQIINKQEQFQQFPSYSSNSSFVSLSKISNDIELPRDKDGSIIWPPEDKTLLPFHVGAQVQSKQQAQFIMNDYSWLNNRQKWYGVLISNDRREFAGSEGQIDSPVLLEVEIEEGEQFLNFDIKSKFPWWIILLIALFIVIVVALLATCSFFINNLNSCISIKQNRFEAILIPIFEFLLIFFLFIITFVNTEFIFQI